MRGRKFLILCWIAVPLLTVANQACMKLLAGEMNENFTSYALLETPWPIAILLCEITCFVLWLRVLSSMPVGRAVPLSAISYVLILALGWFGFGEPILPMQIVGGLLIMGGVYLLGTSSPSVTASNIPA